ncbi:PREDICTED: synaptosomal-associated protein 29 [Drosophila arizonae]|uniref:Synaptosomal-associated protein 29 n=1 Tax=Drosophila arizonae TaxID=7263 RepID=A0ABM1PHB4_DROAR|nr:PREDICTED: synaptosomal-associated protein 29 [Drosophila arizonae]
MANNYLQPVNNHFDIDKFADVDDDLFLRNTRTSEGKAQRSTNPFEDDDEISTSSSIAAQRQAYAERRREIEQRTLDSTQKSLGLLYETEDVGRATAVELARQREQLEKTSNQLDEINSTLRFSQRHLNGLKSVFGGLKNYLSGNRDAPTATASPSGSQVSQETNSNINSMSGGVGGGAIPKHPMSPTERYDNHPVSGIRDDRSSFHQRQAQAQQRAANPFQQQLESNLDEMCDNLSRLKFLATDLGTEIESQNSLLDNMNYKIESVDINLVKQNKEMNKLLKK